jgi:anti-sigma factor RsiW
METCRNITNKLSAYQDRELSPTEMDVIENHLLSCEACNKQYAALLQTCGKLKKLPDIEPASGFSHQIVEKATQTSQPWWARIPGGGFRLLPAPAIVVSLALVGILTGFLLGNSITTRQVNAPPLIAPYTDSALTLASIQVFDAVPPGSFAGGFIRLATFTPETDHAK